MLPNTPSLYSSKHPSMLATMLLNVLDCILSACLTVHSQVHEAHSQEWSHIYSQCTRCHISNLPGSTLPIILSSRLTMPNSLHYMLLGMVLHARSRGFLSCRRQVPGGVRLQAFGGQCLVGGGRWVACGVWSVAGSRWDMLAKIMTSVNMVV
jgi:hypothetical protein